MNTRKRGFSEVYQQMIKDTHPSHWTQFELDLIRCIRDDYSVVYTKNDDLERYQRAVKVRKAWKEIGNKFKDVPVEYIKSKWKSFVDDYVLSRRNVEMNVTGNKKILDGTLSFLDGELHLFDLRTNKNSKKIHKNVNSNEGTSQKETTVNKNVNAGTNEPLSMDVAYNASIRELIHEEIDIEDDDNGIKMETEYDVSTYTTDTEEIALSEHDAKEELESENTDCELQEKWTEEELESENTDRELQEKWTEEELESENTDRELQEKWTEEELLNATRLTKEMIDELIIIKTKQYYSAPASVEK